MNNAHPSEQEKAENKAISSIRVKVEHAIGGIKRYRILTDVFRNKRKNFNDTCMILACGLWNYHLTQS